MRTREGLDGRTALPLPRLRSLGQQPGAERVVLGAEGIAAAPVEPHAVATQPLDRHDSRRRVVTVEEFRGLSEWDGGVGDARVIHTLQCTVSMGRHRGGTGVELWYG
jgi:hypothetical protein